jgi:hypothetical protein
MTPALFLALGLASAMDGPQIKRAPEPRYPVRLVYDTTQELRCAARVTLDEKGRAEVITPVDCADGLADWTVKRVRRYRWEAPVPAGTVADVEVVYTPPVEKMEMPTSYFWRHRELEGCEARIAVSEAGGASVREADPGCAPEVGSMVHFPEVQALLRRSPSVCPVTFVVNDGQARNLDLFRCQPGLWGAAREAVAGWTWPAAEGDRPFRVLLQFDGTPAAE